MPRDLGVVAGDPGVGLRAGPQRRHAGEAAEEDNPQQGHQAGDHSVPPGPPPGPLGPAGPPRQQRLPGQVPPEVLRQRRGRGVPRPGLLGHRLQHDRLQIARDPAIELARPRRLIVHHPLDQSRAIRLGEQGPQGQQLIQRDTQGIDVTPRLRAAIEPLRGHVPTCRRPHRSGSGRPRPRTPWPTRSR